MTQPIDYSGGMPPPQDPTQSIMAGLGQGLQIRQLEAQQRAAQQQALAQQQMQQELYALSVKPNVTGADYARAMTRYPQLSEQLKRATDVMSADQSQAALSHSSQVASALRAGQPELASRLLEQRATALENSGQKQQAQISRTLAGQVGTDPKGVLAGLMPLIAGLPGGDKVIDGMSKASSDQRAEEMQPAAVKKAGADAEAAVSEATSKAVAAKYADQKAVADLEKSGWDIKAIQNDIAYKKESNRINAMNAAANRESNSLKRDELKLKLADTIDKRDTLAREKIAEVTSARTSIDNFLNTADQVLRHPGLSQAVGSVRGRLPSFRADSADFDAMLETLGSQAFIAQIPSMKGTGALSEREGDKLQSSLRSLSSKQSPEQLQSSIEEVQRLMLKARANLKTKFGGPDTIPDTPAAAGNAAAVDAALKKYLN